MVRTQRTLMKSLVLVTLGCEFSLNLQVRLIFSVWAYIRPQQFFPFSFLVCRLVAHKVYFRRAAFGVDLKAFVLFLHLNEHFLNV